MQQNLFTEGEMTTSRPTITKPNVSRSTFYHGDCLIESDKIESESVDLILTDLPYGNMKGLNYNVFNNPSKDNGGMYWDSSICPKKIINIANRILRKNGKMILFAQQPFTTTLINAQVPNLKHNYNIIWEKTDFANCLLVNKSCANFYEDIIIFSKNHQKHDFEGMHPLRPYFKEILNFIGVNKKAIVEKIGQKADHTFRTDSTQYGLCTEKTYNELIEIFGIDKIKDFKQFFELKKVDAKYRYELLKQMNDQYPSIFNLWEGNKYKSNILKYKKDYDGYHPTQKPILLLEDLIKTFSNENNLIVDLTMGSGSTGVACRNTNRHFIGIEQDKKYFDIAVKRVSEYCG